MLVFKYNNVNCIEHGDDVTSYIMMNIKCHRYTTRLILIVGMKRKFKFLYSL